MCRGGEDGEEATSRPGSREGASVTPDSRLPSAAVVEVVAVPTFDEPQRNALKTLPNGSHPNPTTRWGGSLSV